MDTKTLKECAAHLLGRYANWIDSDDVVQTAVTEFLAKGGGSEDQLLVYVALVAGRLKQQARRRFLRESSLSEPNSTHDNDGRLTIGDSQKARTVDPVMSIFMNEVHIEAVQICRTVLEGRFKAEAKALQMERALKILFVDGAESFAAAFELDRLKDPKGPLGRTAAYELWLQVVEKLKLRFADLNDGRGSGNQDKRRK